MALAPIDYEPYPGDQAIKARFINSSTPSSSDDEGAFQRTLQRHYERLAQTVNSNIIDTREKSLALTRLEESLLWAEKALFKSPTN